jgi:hypothetical protein
MRRLRAPLRPCQPRRAVRRALPAALAVLLLTLPLAAGAAEGGPPRTEELRYDWRLGGFLGTVAGFFLPDSGEGVMSIEPVDDGMLATELMITSPDGAAGEHWRYGSKISGDSGYATEAWNSYQWRDKKEQERVRIEEEGAFDIVSGIYRIRRELPQAAKPMRIWSDGKVYPVVVIPRGEEKRKVGGRKIATRHYTVRGYRAGEGRYWKGSLDLWLAKDAAATPVEMHISRSMANLKLELRDLDGVR